MKVAHHANRPWNGNYIEPHLAEDAILAPAKLLEFRLGAISQKMAEDVAPLAAIQNEIHLGLGYIAFQRLEKRAPSLAMHRMTVDENAIHVKDDAAQLSKAHEFSPGGIWDSSKKRIAGAEARTNPGDSTRR